MKKRTKFLICMVLTAAILGACTDKAGVADTVAESGTESATAEKLPEVTLILNQADAGGTVDQPETDASRGDDESGEDIEGAVEVSADTADARDEADTTGENAETDADTGESEATVIDGLTVSTVSLTDSMPYASFSAINTGAATLYKNPDPVRGKYVICVNAGHGTKGGQSVKTQCHPDGSPKVTGGTTGAGATTAVAVSSGMTFGDGKSESSVTLAQALILKEMLLDAGYSVLMIRETDDVQLDNVARTVLANEFADCHIALHWDSSEKDKGAFYCSVPDVASYRAMEPVASTWQKSHALGDSIIAGLKGQGIKIFSSGTMALDLTQTSYSSIPSIDLELGDKASDHSDSRLRLNAAGIITGLDAFFGIG